jgi:hypothetical protein
VYYLTDRNNRPLTEALISGCLEKTIHKYLEEEASSGNG